MAMDAETYVMAKKSVMDHESDAVVSICRDAVNVGTAHDAVRGIQDGLIETAELFDLGRVTMAQMSSSCMAAKAGMDVLSTSACSISHPAIILATIEGDRHSQGKDVLRLELSGLGFNVIDLGSDVPVDVIIKEAIDRNAEAVVTSVIMSTALPNEMVLEERLRTAGIRDKVITCIGGPPTTQAWADRIGADIWTRNSSGCMKRLLESFPSMR